jgi:hypothetical protein
MGHINQSWQILRLRINPWEMLPIPGRKKQEIFANTFGYSDIIGGLIVLGI